MNKKIYNKNSRTHKLSIATAFFGSMFMFVPTVREFIPQEYYGLLFIFVGVVNHYLRSVTTTPIDER